MSNLPHSPLPWKIVRHPTPYFDWICDSTGGCVALGFSFTDERILLAAPQLRAVCAHLVAWMEGELAGGATLGEIADEARAALAGLG